MIFESRMEAGTTLRLNMSGFFRMGISVQQCGFLQRINARTHINNVGILPNTKLAIPSSNSVRLVSPIQEIQEPNIQIEEMTANESERHHVK